MVVESKESGGRVGWGEEGWGGVVRRGYKWSLSAQRRRMKNICRLGHKRRGIAGLFPLLTALSVRCEILTLFPPLGTTVVPELITVTVNTDDIAPIRNVNSIKLRSNHIILNALAGKDLGQRSPYLRVENIRQDKSQPRYFKF